MSGLNYSSEDTGLATFNVNCSAINFTATMGSLQKVSGIMGAFGTLFNVDAASFIGGIGRA